MPGENAVRNRLWSGNSDTQRPADPRAPSSACRPEDEGSAGYLERQMADPFVKGFRRVLHVVPDEVWQGAGVFVRTSEAHVRLAAGPSISAPCRIRFEPGFGAC